MTTFDDRERAFEAKFAHDAELQFKVDARRNKLIGLWAAGLLGKEGEAATAYAKEVVAADFVEAGHEDVIAKLAADLGDKASDAEIRAQFAALLATAKDQVFNEA